MKEVTDSLISVIIPVYNSEKYINRAIESVLAQTYDNIELILINDGSSDNSESICREYCDRDSRCLYFYQDNSGPDIARREGYRKSHGEYVVFLDSDDYLADNMLEKTYSVMCEENADIVCCGMARVDHNDREWDQLRLEKNRTVIETDKSKYEAFFAIRILQGSYCAKIVKREILADYDFVHESIVGEDITAALYMYRKAQKIVLISDLLYFYFWNLESISHTKYTRRHAVSLDNYIRVRDEILAEHYIDDAPVCGFFAERQMAVATAMSRGHVFDSAVSAVLRKDLKSHWKDIRRNTYTPLYMKMCILMYIVAPRIFHLAYMIVYALTGR